MFPTRDPYHHKVFLLAQLVLRGDEECPIDRKHDDHKAILNLRRYLVIHRDLTYAHQAEIDRLWNSHQHHLSEGERRIIDCMPFISEPPLR